MPFFSSLTHTGTRVAGQGEIGTQRFEAGCPIFPDDYPTTPSYESVVDEVAENEKQTWERKPPAKRPNWEKLGTRNPWKPDWHLVLGLRQGGDDTGTEDLISTQRPSEDNGNMDAGNVEERVPPWLFRGNAVVTTIDSISNSSSPTNILSVEVNKWRAKRSLASLSCSENSLLKSALVSVRLSIPRSGSPSVNAMVYKMTDDEAKKWYPMVERDGEEFTETEVRFTEFCSC